jgi:hypothetical protein
VAQRGPAQCWRCEKCAATKKGEQEFVTRWLTEEGDLVVVRPWHGGAPVKEGQR